MLAPRAAGGTRPESPKTRCLSSSEITGSQVQEYEYLQSIVNLHGEIRRKTPIERSYLATDPGTPHGP